MKLITFYLFFWFSFCFVDRVISCDCEEEDDGIPPEPPRVTVKQGNIVGTTMVSISGRPIRAFLGIPFGKITKRFTRPEPADAWDGDFHAYTNGPMCPQFVVQLNQVMGDEEYCLTLNVFNAKNSSDDEKIPVMVFIYGGAFVFGNSMLLLYNPSFLLDKDVVLVVINYRVGLLGFLSTGDDAASGNWGLWDQHLALQWVQDNIEAFGGDKTNVIIFGESAGAASVTYHLVSPHSKGLFHGAIAQSGSALCPWALDENPLRTASIAAKELNCPTDDTAALVDCMRSKSYKNISEISFKSFNFVIAPSVEFGNSNGFLNEHPYVLLREGRFNKVPVMMGVLLHEGAHFFNTYGHCFDNVTNENFYETGLKYFLGNVTDKDFVEEQPDLLKEIGHEYFEDVDFNNETAVKMAKVALTSACMFDGCNDITIKLLAAQDIPVYSYLFVYISKVIGTITTYSGEPDVFHGLDVGFLFEANLFLPTYSEEDMKIVGKMTTLWTNFAYDYNPTPNGIPVEWNRTSSKENQFLRIGKQMEMDDQFRNERLAHWLPFHIKYLESQLK